MRFSKFILVASIFWCFTQGSLAETSNYEGHLIFGNRSKAGLLVSGNHNSDGLLVVSRDSKVILAIPVLTSELSLGFSVGVQTTGATTTTFRIDGLSENTRVSDLFESYSGVTTGVTISIPGPCCLTVGKELLELMNPKGLHLSGKFSSFGEMVDLSKTIMTIKLNRSFTDRKEVANQTLGSLRALQFEGLPSDRSLIELDCISTVDSASHFILMNGFGEIVYEVFSLNPFELFNQTKTRGLKPYVTKNTIVLYPESRNNRVSGYRFDIDLRSESTIEKDHYGREFSYSVQRSTANSQIALNCLSTQSLKDKESLLNSYFNSIWKK
jgi:hypothetical protein